MKIPHTRNPNHKQHLAFFCACMCLWLTALPPPFQTAGQELKSEDQRTPVFSSFIPVFAHLGRPRICSPGFWLKALSGQ